MLMLATIPITCWLCALIAKPRRPSAGNEVQEFVYSRLLGRHQQLSLLALVVTAGAFMIFVLSLSQQADPTLHALRDPHRRCTQPVVGFPFCVQLQSDGTWVQEELQDNGTWLVVATVSATAARVIPDDDPAPNIKK